MNEIAVSILSIIGLLTIAYIIAKVLSPIFRFLLDKACYYLAAFASTSPFLRKQIEYIGKCAFKQRDDSTVNKEDSIQIEYPSKCGIHYLIGIKPRRYQRFPNTDAIQNFNNCDSCPLNKDAFNVFNCPVIKPLKRPPV